MTCRFGDVNLVMSCAACSAAGVPVTTSQHLSHALLDKRRPEIFKTAINVLSLDRVVVQHPSLAHNRTLVNTKAEYDATDDAGLPALAQLSERPDLWNSNIMYEPDISYIPRCLDV